MVKNDSHRHLREMNGEVKRSNHKGILKPSAGTGLADPAHPATTEGKIRFHHYSLPFISVGQQGKV